MPGCAAAATKYGMERTHWRRVFTYTGLAVIGLALAYFSTAVATSGIAAATIGKRDAGADLFTSGSVALLVGVAMFAVFGFLALRLAWMLNKSKAR